MSDPHLNILKFNLMSGAANEASSVFDDGVSMLIQKQYLHVGLPVQCVQSSNEDHSVASSRPKSSETVSPRQLKNTNGYSLQDVSGNYHRTASSQSFNGGPGGFPFYNTPSPMASQSHSQV